nr:PREDICTED: uncharacterized acetyltransferase At3g50280-like [Bemisia tabaci]XP_018914096.1 PREDICTED: uncharacterized acetyltransferase At3g50280-like isoform X1 [Bemisia tabaci]
MQSQNIQHIKECFVKPQYVTEESKQPYYLMPFELSMLSWHYIQKGLLFETPPQVNRANFMNDLLDRLKYSLSLTLVQYYPLAGRLVTEKQENDSSYLIFVDCINSPGAKFIHAKIDMTTSDILSTRYNPLIVRSFFDHKTSVSFDGRTKPLVSIQVTEFKDGVFIGCSMSHAITDGTIYWRFWNTLSNIFQTDESKKIERPPVNLKRWFSEGRGPLVDFPVTFQDEFITNVDVPEGHVTRKFHFSADSVAKLKAKANSECNTTVISSFQSLIAHLWRSITKARRLPSDRIVSCNPAVNVRPRMIPPLPADCFGCMTGAATARTTAGELLEKSLGWAAWQLHQAIVSYTDTSVREFTDEWLRTPSIVDITKLFAPNAMNIGGSSRFDMYGNEFGMGKALTILSGTALKFDGSIETFPGREGGGCVDFGVCLGASTMEALESDEEFMAFTS